MQDIQTPQTADMNDPCVKICVRDRETQICLGCGRSAGEIAAWDTLSATERTAILAEKEARLNGLTNKRRTARRGRPTRTEKP